MKINPQSFFNFCANHASLLRALSERGGELSETEVMRLIHANPSAIEELPETAWRRLRELQILVPTEPGSELLFMAEPLSRLLTYLFNEANPATPEIIRGYVMSLETTGKQLGRALDEEDVQRVKLAFDEISQTLRRIHADLNETQHAILAEVARYKTERARVAVREKYRLIVHWMERYVEPMIEIVRADGPMRAAFDETDRLLNRAREEALFNDHPALVRNVRFLRLVGDHALRVFTQCRKEIQPLYESLRRSSFITKWRDAFREALGPNGRLVMDLVPELGLIIGEQPPAPELPVQDARRRFLLVLRRFIEVFARPEHPLALFLDDLQWLDVATLDLIEELLTATDIRHLMLIGAYRDNEVSSSHPLIKAIGPSRYVFNSYADNQFGNIRQGRIRGRPLIPTHKIRLDNITL